MAEHYTDEDVEAVAPALAEHRWHHTKDTHCSCGWRCPLAQLAVERWEDHVARAVLDAVAPAIATRREAQVLREASERYAKFPRPDSGLIPKEWADGFMEALDGVADDLLRRADEIEGR